MTKLLKCILVDDEKDALDGLEILLSGIGNIEITDKINCSENAAKIIQAKNPDLVFLDIDMPLKNGFEVLEEINNLKIKTKVVFATAYNQYILKALRNSAFDYLTKPIDRLELKEVIRRAIEQDPNEENLSLNSLQMIKIPCSNGCVFLKKEDLIYLKADGNYTKIITPEETIISSQNLGKFEEAFYTDNFLRISKSFLINSKYLSKFDKKRKICTLKYEDNIFELTVSRRNLNIFDNIQ
ncbi:MAG: response regulator transcription factor [Bacteroidales bacterium]|nr:response regulator transcription factor [Bacteroidales bacterium]